MNITLNLKLLSQPVQALDQSLILIYSPRRKNEKNGHCYG